MATKWVRVKDKTTKHEFTIDEASVTDAVEVLDKRAVGAGTLRPTPHVSKGGKKSASSATASAASEGTTSQGDNR